jgi:hypothetical protein
MDKNSDEAFKQKSSEAPIKKEEENKKSEIKPPINSDSIGFDKFFTLADDNQFNSENYKETNKNNNQKKANKEEEFEYKISIDLSDANNKKIHNYLNEDLIDALEKSLDEPIDNQELSHNENDTNYSQNNVSNDTDIYNNNFSNMNNNNFNFYPQDKNQTHNTISFFPKAKKNEDNIINNNNNETNKKEKNKSIKKLADYFGSNNPLDAPVYIPQKFKSLKFNQKSNKIGDNIVYDNNNNESIDKKKEEKCKKPFEIREGDWTCEFCYNLNFAFRTKCNRCGLIKDFLQIKNNLSVNNNDTFQNCQNLIQTNSFIPSKNNYPFLNSNIPHSSLFSPNTSNYP